MNTGPASGVAPFARESEPALAAQDPSTVTTPAEAEQLPDAVPDKAPATLTAEAPAPSPRTPQPPPYLLRETAASDSPADPDGAGEQVVMPAILALVEAAQAGEPPENLAAVIEALLFAAEEPPTVSELAQATQVSRDAIEEALDELSAAAGGRGLRVQRDGSRVRLVTAPEATSSIQRLLGIDRPNKLSKPALETLAIIAYQQPVTRGAIERVRGVNCDAPVATLRLREMIASVGQADTPGRPHLWATTPAFLDHFGLTTLAELPPLPGLPAPAEQGALELADRSQPDDESDFDEPAAGLSVDDAGAAPSEAPTVAQNPTALARGRPDVIDLAADAEADVEADESGSSDADDRPDERGLAPLEAMEPEGGSAPAAPSFAGRSSPEAPWDDSDLGGLAAAGGD